MKLDVRIALVDNSRGWGGAEQILFSLATGLRSRGHHVGLFLSEGSETVDKFVQGGFLTWAIPRKGVGTVRGIVKMIRIARSEKFDLIHLHRNHDLLVGKIVSYFAGKLPLLLTQHCLLGNTSFSVMNLADRIATVSKFIAEGIVERIPRLHRKLLVVHNGVDTDKFEHLRDDYWKGRHELAGRGPLLGVVGYFYKNQEELIEILPRIRAVYPDMMLIIMGQDDSKMDYLKKRVTECGVADSVFFAGNIEHSEMPRALAGIDLNISAFRREGFGLSVIEGMAAGTPFVGYRAGGYEEIVTQGENGYLVESQDEFVEIIIELLGDKERLNSLGGRAKGVVRQRFSVDRMLTHYETVYADLLKENNSPMEGS